MEHTLMLRVKSLNKKDYGGNIIAVAARHNLEPEARDYAHIDQCKITQNVVLRGAGRAVDVAAEAVRLMELAKVKPLRINASLGIEIIFSLPPASGIAERDFFTDAVAWAELFFEIPILSAVIHNDEPKPHCHIIMLPLLNGRMIGNQLIGNKTHLLAMLADFHAKVGQGYGLKRGTPAKRYSGAARASAADRIVTALRRTKNSLDDPAIRDALRDAIAETMPVHLMELLGLDMPEVRTPKPKTFASIMTKNCPERKHKRAIVVQSKNAIVVTPATSAAKVKPLSCVVVADSPLPVPPDNCPLQDEFIRESDTGQAAECWDESRGEFIKLPVKTKPRSAEVDRVKVLLRGAGVISGGQVRKDRD